MNFVKNLKVCRASFIAYATWHDIDNEGAHSLVREFVGDYVTGLEPRGYGRDTAAAFNAELDDGRLEVPHAKATNVRLP